ncbi:MAG TPA: DUF2339 domain-containing protein [Verrucomicrobiae bacterium]|nr:DUF2339 domain-containing protein [Verrucomicrobiae bacterium]
MEVVFYLGIVLLVLFGPWVLVWRVNRRRNQERLEDQARWTDLVGRVSALERDLRQMRSQASTPAAPAATRVAAVEHRATPPTLVISVTPSPSETPAQKVAQSWVKHELEPAPAATPAQTKADAPAAPIASQVSAPPGPTFADTELRSSLLDRFTSALDIEEMLGTDWLNKLGIALLVLGVAFFLAYQLRTMGPGGKVLVGYVTGAVMLAAGVWFERADRYRILARAGIGGGWALLFFTTYAMYHVPAAQLLNSQTLDLVLMLAVASAMVLHTLRYRSQVVTGLAFLLAFLTVTISHSSVYSLSAGAVLAAALVVIVGRMQWFELEVFGILASYLNHFLWLRPIIEPMQGKRHPFPEFAASAGILILYWVIFRLSYVFRLPSDPERERISTAAAVLNTSLLLALLKYQSVHPEWAFWALLAIGAVESGLAQLPATRRRRSAVIVLATLGVVLLIVAFPFRYSGTRLSVLWLAEGEALLLIGVWTKEIIFRRLGMLASVLVAGQMLAYDAAEIFGRRMDNADLRADFPLAVLFVIAGIVFYLNAHWTLPRWPGMFATEFDRRIMQRFSYVGAVLMLAAVWIAFPQSWTAVAWCALGFALAVAGRRLSSRDLRYQANSLAVIAIIRVLAMNLEGTDKFHGLTLRLITITLVAVLLYATSRWSSPAMGEEKIAVWLRRLESEGYTWTASFLLALLAWYELRPVSVADAWVIGGLVLLELGLVFPRANLRMQGYVVMTASFFRIFFVNLNAAGTPGEISPRFYTVVPIALAFVYSYWRLNQAGDTLNAIEQRFRVAGVFSWLGTITLAALMRFELEADWVAAAWAALAFALFAIAWRSGRKIFLHQGLLIVFGVAFRTVLHNFYERSYFPAPPWESRWVTAGSTIALLLAALPLAFRIRKKDKPSEETGVIRLLRGLGRRPEQLLFFVAVALLTVLLAVEMRHGVVTLSWGLEGVAVFLLALWVAERSFRLTGLGLLLLCVGKIVLQDVWRLNPRDRYLTFIVLGAALLLVSFLYTRNREALRQYL